MQVEIFRSFVLMNFLKIPLDNWVEKLTNNPVLRTIAGFTLDNLVKTSSYYDFINRTVPLNEPPEIKPNKKKPKDKPKKGEKLPPKKPGAVADIVNQVINEEDKLLRRLSRRPERFLQRIFARVAVDTSVSLGLVPNAVNVSGDGTCIETGASSYGVKVCKCRENGIYRCDCDRKYSDPNANWGWDSYEERFFYGYTGYFISTYCRPEKIDLPLYLRLVQANRHDSVSAIFSLAEFRELYPNLHINTFISDSASDNYATYELLNHWNMNAVIALNEKNKGNYKYPPALRIDNDGTPICPGGCRMKFDSFCKDRCRLKWRCPRTWCDFGPLDACASCSHSSYGRVIYTKPHWDPRLFTRIPRDSQTWKTLMKERTAAERSNKRILHDYGIEGTHIRSKKRLSFFVTLAGINVHLDAQLKYLISKDRFDFNQLIFGIQDNHICAA